MAVESTQLHSNISWKKTAVVLLVLIALPIVSLLLLHRTAKKSQSTVANKSYQLPAKPDEYFYHTEFDPARRLIARASASQTIGK